MRRLSFVLAIAAAAIAMLFWHVDGAAPSSERQRTSPSPRSPPSSTDADPAQRIDARDAIASVAADTHRSSKPDPGDASTGDPAAVLRIRLRGLDPRAPWSTPFGLDWRGVDAAGEERLERLAIVLAADGTGHCLLPPQVAEATPREWQTQVWDPNYEPLYWRRQGALDLDQELVLDVQAVAVVTGRVVDARGAGIAPAQVTAFDVQGGRMAGPAVRHTNTERDGTYQLRVPGGVPLTLVATAMEPLRYSGLEMLGGGVPSTGGVRPELLPATCTIVGSFNGPTEAPDLVLLDSPMLTGVVQWPDGTPVHDAQLGATGLDGEYFQLGDRASVRRSPAGSLWIGTSARTARDGTFALPDQGTACRLIVAELRGCPVWADLIVDAAPAPSHTVITLPAPVTLRAVRAGVPAGGATFRFDHGVERSADEDGCVRVLTDHPLGVHATAGRAASATVQFDVADRGRTIELQLVDARTRVAIEFEGGLRVRNAAFRWHGEGGRSGRQTLVRDDRGGPFELFLEPGHYRLRASAAPGERNGTCLLPVERDLQVGAVDLELTLPATFGGLLVVHATDPGGRYVAAHCRVRDAQGRDRTAPFVADGRVGPPGELHDSGACTLGAVLEPGDYELELTTAAGAVLRERTAIEPRQTAMVRFRVR